MGPPRRQERQEGILGVLGVLAVQRLSPGHEGEQHVAEYLDREHFIPLRKNDLMQLLLHDKQLPPGQREPFRQFCRLISATIHFEYLAKLEDLKDAYAPFDPDADTKPDRPPSPE